MSDGTAGTGEYTYQWNAGGVAIVGEDDPTLVVASEYIGKTLSVTVTNENGDTATSDETAPVANDLSAEITLNDKNGLQSDGTALPTDTLEVNYGQDLGTPSTVIWWCDGAAKAVYTTEGGALVDAFTSTAIQTLDVVPPIGELDEGDWWVTIENTEGLTSVTNVITVAESHIAIIEDVTITDDYATDGSANLDIAKTTNKSVVTVTLNKEYVGDFYLAHEKATKFSKADLKHAIDVSAAVPVTSLSKFTDAAAVAATTGKSISYLDKKTGEITYKFTVDMSAAGAALNDIKRGDSYYLIFDQDGFDFDDMPATDSADFEDLNASDLVEVPYLEAPDSIEVTSYSNGGSTVKVTMNNEDGATLAWWDSTAATVAGTKGISDVNVFYTASNTASASDVPAGLAVATPIAIKDGVLSATTAAASDKNYAYAKISFTAGIFAEDEITLTSAVKETNEVPATSFTLGESSSDPKAAEIKLENLKGRASGTVYVFQGNAALAATPGKANTNASDLVGQEKNGPWMVGSATVAGGETKVIIENVFNKNQMTDTNEKYFAALFVPDDDEYYASMTTDADGTAGGSQSFELKQQLKSYKLKSPVEKKTAASVAGVVVGVDQFGQEIDLTTWASGAGSAALAITTEAKPLDNSTTAKATDDTVQVTIAATGGLSLAVGTGANTTDNGFTKGTAHSFDIAGGQKVTVTCADAGAGTDATALFTVTLN